MHSSSSLVFINFANKEITSMIKSLQTKNSHGYDEISTKLLKISATYICSPLIYTVSVITLSCQELFLIIEVPNYKTYIQEKR